MTHLVIVHIQIVWSREDGDERREPGGLAFSVHSVARVLCLVCPDNWQKIVLLKEITAGCIAIKRTKMTIFLRSSVSRWQQTYKNTNILSRSCGWSAQRSSRYRSLLVDLTRAGRTLGQMQGVLWTGPTEIRWIKTAALIEYSAPDRIRWRGLLLLFKPWYDSS